jgi:hypothetical protein
VKLEPLPSSFASTRDALHAVAEHVLAAKRYSVDGHIGLEPTMGGFGTPVIDRWCARVEGASLVVLDDDGERRTPITTLAAGAAFVDGPLGAPAGVYTPVTACVPDAPITIDLDASVVLATWLAFADGLLAAVRDEYAASSPTTIQMWPEHFDIGCSFGDANYGASPGDSGIPEPYLYVGPWNEAQRTGELGAYGFGAALTYDELYAAPDAHEAGMAFYRRHAATLAV